MKLPDWALVGEPLLPMPRFSVNGYWAEVILHSDKDGTFEGISILPEILPFVKEAEKWMEKGDPVKKPEDAKETIGSMVLYADTNDGMPLCNQSQDSLLLFGYLMSKEAPIALWISWKGKLLRCRIVCIYKMWIIPYFKEEG